MQPPAIDATLLSDPGTVLAYMDDCTIAVPSCLANRVAAEHWNLMQDSLLFFGGVETHLGFGEFSR